MPLLNEVVFFCPVLAYNVIYKQDKGVASMATAVTVFNKGDIIFHYFQDPTNKSIQKGAHRSVVLH